MVSKGLATLEVWLITLLFKLFLCLSYMPSLVNFFNSNSSNPQKSLTFTPCLFYSCKKLTFNRFHSSTRDHFSCMLDTREEHMQRIAMEICKAHVGFSFPFDVLSSCYISSMCKYKFCFCSNWFDDLLDTFYKNACCVSLSHIKL